ncbi:MAG: hypothetical protein KatS3mg085_285 [Candidatus Dojkabacteria bacterium]|nr:MAG: hypothetical protein KatS3mg085_285 [Candidatus Dojkabacteria bacterium]GIW58897.1 MAG: hypothetical protein KatS3mg086_182 [Candidatus Dojkabacteria bacterium]
MGNNQNYPNPDQRPRVFIEVTEWIAELLYNALRNNLDIRQLSDIIKKILLDNRLKLLNYFFSREHLINCYMLTDKEKSDLEEDFKRELSTIGPSTILRRIEIALRLYFKVVDEKMKQNLALADLFSPVDSTTGHVTYDPRFGSEDFNSFISRLKDLANQHDYNDIESFRVAVQELFNDMYGNEATRDELSKISFILLTFFHGSFEKINNDNINTFIQFFELVYSLLYLENIITNNGEDNEQDDLSNTYFQINPSNESLWEAIFENLGVCFQLICRAFVYNKNGSWAEMVRILNLDQIYNKGSLVKSKADFECIISQYYPGLDISWQLTNGKWELSFSYKDFEEWRKHLLKNVSSSGGRCPANVTIFREIFDIIRILAPLILYDGLAPEQ